MMHEPVVRLMKREQHLRASQQQPVCRGRLSWWITKLSYLPGTYARLLSNAHCPQRAAPGAAKHATMHATQRLDSTGTCGVDEDIKQARSHTKRM